MTTNPRRSRRPAIPVPQYATYAHEMMAEAEETNEVSEEIHEAPTPRRTRRAAIPVPQHTAGAHKMVVEVREIPDPKDYREGTDEVDMITCPGHGWKTSSGMPW